MLLVLVLLVLPGVLVVGLLTLSKAAAVGLTESGCLEEELGALRWSIAWTGVLASVHRVERVLAAAVCCCAVRAVIWGAVSVELAVCRCWWVCGAVERLVLDGVRGAVVDIVLVLRVVHGTSWCMRGRVAAQRR